MTIVLYVIQSYKHEVCKLHMSSNAFNITEKNPFPVWLIRMTKTIVAMIDKNVRNERS